MQVSATTWSTLSKLLDEALDLEPLDHLELVASEVMPQL